MAVRNDDLDAVMERVPERRYGDLVFIQNGMLRPWLLERELHRCSRGLIFFAVPHMNDGVQPGGVSPFVGPMAQQVVDWFKMLELEAQALDASEFEEFELEKLLWISVFGLCCQALDMTVGEVVESRSEVINSLVAELMLVSAKEFPVSVSSKEMAGRLCTYSLSIHSYRASVKEWSWRNGYFVDTAARMGIRTPLHAELLARIQKTEPARI